MEGRVVALTAAIGLVGLLALVGMQWKFELGRFAENPQRIALAPGTKSIVGGGRAVLAHAGGDGAQLVLELSCAADASRFTLVQGARSEEVCGVRARWVELAADFARGVPRAVVEVSWEP